MAIKSYQRIRLSILRKYWNSILAEYWEFRFPNAVCWTCRLGRMHCLFPNTRSSISRERTRSRSNRVPKVCGSELWRAGGCSRIKATERQQPRRQYPARLVATECGSRRGSLRFFVTATRTHHLAATRTTVAVFFADGLIKVDFGDVRDCC